MITLTAVRLHWLKDDGEDDPTDLCAHSPVHCQVDDLVFATPEDGDWTVSASAIFLLRSLHRDHTKESNHGNQIFPCCGHSVYDVGLPEVEICCCNSGIDLEIRRTEIGFLLKSKDGKTCNVSEPEWKQAVYAYSDLVMAFYEKSQPKQASDNEERNGFDAMMLEWKRLRCGNHHE